MTCEGWREMAYLECKIDSQGWVITKDTAGVATPQGQDTFILGDPDNAIQQAFVPRMLPIHDHHVAVLRLQEQLGPLHRRHNCVCNPTHGSTHHQIFRKIGPCCFLDLPFFAFQCCFLPRSLQVGCECYRAQLEQRRQGAHPYHRSLPSFLHLPHIENPLTP